MSGVTGFKHDIFISYAHLDNKVLEPQMDGWVKQFFLNLELMLTNRFGRPGMVKIWLDKKKLAGNTMFDKSIADTIKDSAVIISLNSMSYKASDYCQQELKMFYDKAKNEPLGVAIGDKSRIIHVLLNNIPYQEWPEELSGTSGFPFHDSTDPESLGDPLETTSKEFREKMKQLRDALWVTL
ncbi:MAG: toll/interleukin-1 receptor domain-containing protein, partial [Flavobacteriaceae bacterium]|nr:toll/interleukin-1 receptor domain-containing protein [Flavobacteriaceae bacterium]